MKDVEISIITPSYNMLGYLKRCAASISDQESVHLEHIVVDAMSEDGTQEWLRGNQQVRSTIEKDAGMYHALNKGLKQAKGEIVGHLNCDEQYLPGTLEFVRNYFEAHPDVDILFGDMLLVNPNGSLIAYRKAFMPRWIYILSSYLYVYTCSMFFRRRIVADGFYFDERLKGIGDMEFVVRLLRNGYKTRHVRRYFAAFTLTGNNLCINDESFRQERREFDRSIPLWIRLLKHPLNFLRLAEKAMHGSYRQKMPIEYDIYDLQNLACRKHYMFSRASFIFRTR